MNDQSVIGEWSSLWEVSRSPLAFDRAPDVCVRLRCVRPMGVLCLVGMLIVPILYRDPAFEAFADFSDFVESVSCETSETCQVRGSNPCRGVKTANLLIILRFFPPRQSDKPKRRLFSGTFGSNPCWVKKQAWLVAVAAQSRAGVSLVRVARHPTEGARFRR
jgi:hypothetical protein